MVDNAVIRDMAFGLGMERPKVLTTEGRGSGSVHIVTFGPPSFRQTIQIGASLPHDYARGLMQRALTAVLPKPHAQSA